MQSYSCAAVHCDTSGAHKRVDNIRTRRMPVVRSDKASFKVVTASPIRVNRVLRAFGRSVPNEHCRAAEVQLGRTYSLHDGLDRGQQRINARVGCVGCVGRVGRDVLTECFCNGPRLSRWVAAVTLQKHGGKGRSKCERERVREF